MQLAAQVDELRAGGSRVETVFPDPDATHLFGANAMNPRIARRQRGSAASRASRSRRDSGSSGDETGRPRHLRKRRRSCQIGPGSAWIVSSDAISPSFAQ